MKHCAALFVIAILGGLLVRPAAAQTQRSGNAASAQMLQQLQQLASERTALQADNAKMKAELEKVRKERDTLKQSQTAVEQRGRASQAAVAARAAADAERLQADLTREKTRMEELVSRFRETAVTLRDVETERTTVKQSLATRDQELKACVDHNLKLYELNKEVLTKFEDQGLWSSLARREPFTQLKRVQLENLIDGYRDRAQDQRTGPGLP